MQYRANRVQDFKRQHVTGKEFNCRSVWIGSGVESREINVRPFKLKARDQRRSERAVA